MVDLFSLGTIFLHWDTVLELAFAIITLIVGIFALRIYNLSEQKQSLLFGISFLFISASYLIKSITNYLIISKLNENICRGLKIYDVSILNSIGTYSYVFLFIIGLITLAYMTIHQKSIKIYFLTLAITVISLIFSSNTVLLFYILSSIILIIILIHYIINYSTNKQGKTLLVLIAFSFLLFGSIHFILSVNHSLFYFIGHILELIAYLLILINLIWVNKK